MKLKCNNLGVLESNDCTTVKGNKYMFHKGMPTEVNDADDIKYFLKQDGGHSFKKLSSMKETKIEDLLDSDEPISMETFSNLKVEHKIRLIEKYDPKTKVSKRSTNGVLTQEFMKLQNRLFGKAKCLTEEEVYALNKEEQIKIIRSYEVSTKIPNFEKDRVELVLSLQNKS